MSRVIVDIETVGASWEALDAVQQEYLLKFAETEEEQSEVKERLALSPLTGEIVAIGMLNPDTMKGLMLYQNGGGAREEFEENGVQFESGTEAEILAAFWDQVQKYDQIVTFNGRGFDGPFLHLRSAIQKIRPSRNLVPYRYDYKFHCDLLDQLTFYGASRKFNLDFYAKAFGIKSPKADGLNGLIVADLYKEGKYHDIARYCLGDLVATKELFDYWEGYLRF